MGVDKEGCAEGVRACAECIRRIYTMQSDVILCILSIENLWQFGILLDHLELELDSENIARGR